MSELRKGDKVRIIGGSHGNISYIGYTGVVTNVYGPANIAVKIDNVARLLMSGSTENIVSYYRAEDLVKLINDPLIETYKDPAEESIKHDCCLVATMRYINNPNFVVKAALYDQSINIGDLCVARIITCGDLVMQVVNVSYSDDSETVSSEVICRVDYTEYNKRKACRERKAELVQLMSEKAGQMDVMQLFDMLANCDGDIAQLLSEYKELEGVK